MNRAALVALWLAFGLLAVSVVVLAVAIERGADRIEASVEQAEHLVGAEVHEDHSISHSHSHGPLDTPDAVAEAENHEHAHDHIVFHAHSAPHPQGVEALPSFPPEPSATETTAVGTTEVVDTSATPTAQTTTTVAPELPHIHAITHEHEHPVIIVVPDPETIIGGRSPGLVPVPTTIAIPSPTTTAEQLIPSTTSG